MTNNVTQELISLGPEIVTHFTWQAWPAAERACKVRQQIVELFVNLAVTAVLEAVSGGGVLQIPDIGKYVLAQPFEMIKNKQRVWLKGMTEITGDVFEEVIKV